MSAMQKQSTVGKDVSFERIRRITGYLVGTMDKWNDAKKAEEHDRVKHGLSCGNRRGKHRGWTGHPPDRLLSGVSAPLSRLPEPGNLGVCRAHQDVS